MYTICNHLNQIKFLDVPPEGRIIADQASIGELKPYHFNPYEDVKPLDTGLFVYTPNPTMFSESEPAFVKEIKAMNVILDSYKDPQSLRNLYDRIKDISQKSFMNIWGSETISQINGIIQTVDCPEMLSKLRAMFSIQAESNHKSSLTFGAGSGSCNETGKLSVILQAIEERMKHVESF